MIHTTIFRLLYTHKYC